MNLNVCPVKDFLDCYSYAKAMAFVNPILLRYVEGQYSQEHLEKWIDHAWCETPGGQIVDLYSVMKLPDAKFKYRHK